MAYTIQINEHQRVILVKAAANTQNFVKAWLLGLPSDNGESSALVDLQVLVDMLGGLPKIEAESPGVIHGLCL